MCSSDLVPHEAIQTIAGQPTVFVEESAGRFAPRTVTLGVEVDGLVEVVSGLADGDTVVVGGSFVLKAELLRTAAQPEGGR